MSAGRARNDAARRRRRLGLALAGMLLAGAGLGLALASRGRQRRAAEAGAERARVEAGHLRAAQEKRERLARALERLRGRPALAGELLAALARATPPEITLREVSCHEDAFLIRGHAHAAGGAPGDPLRRFRRELCPPEAPWRIPDPPNAEPADFTWRGSFLYPPPPAGDLPALEAQLAAARAALRPAGAFEAWWRAWSRSWNLLAQSTEREPGLEVRHYALAYAQPRLGAWSDLVRALQLLGTEPGLTVDSLVLAAPEGAEAFTQAQLTLTARLRP